MPSLPSYVLITPARNEAQFLESVVQSVVTQTVLPLRWVIVSDGSTDGTDEIVQRYAAQYAWIELLRMPERTERHFAGKAYALMAGVERVRDIPYEVIASLDADITFDEGYFAYLLDKLASDPQLGLAGTPYIDALTEVYDYRFVSVEDVSGACQVFRRACFEAIGGYVPVKGGAIDTIAVLTARMKGWKTRCFTGKVSQHHRKQGTAQCGPIRAQFNSGARDYALGNHPLWQLFRVAYQLTKKPLVIRGLAIGAGFSWSWMQRCNRPISRELIAFRRKEQMARLGRFFVRGPQTQLDDSGPVH